MKQSDERVPGRSTPPSFGRGLEEKREAGQDFTIRGGEAFHLVLHVNVVPDAESLETLRAAIQKATRQGVLEGYAAAFAEMDAEPADAGGGSGVPPPAGPAAEAGGGG